MNMDKLHESLKQTEVKARRNFLINELSKHTDEGTLSVLSLAELEREHIKVIGKRL